MNLTNYDMSTRNLISRVTKRFDSNGIKDQKSGIKDHIVFCYI